MNNGLGWAKVKSIRLPTGRERRLVRNKTTEQFSTNQFTVSMIFILSAPEIKILYMNMLSLVMYFPPNIHLLHKVNVLLHYYQVFPLQIEGNLFLCCTILLDSSCVVKWRILLLPLKFEAWMAIKMYQSYLNETIPRKILLSLIPSTRPCASQWYFFYDKTKIAPVL